MKSIYNCLKVLGFLLVFTVTTKAQTLVYQDNFTPGHSGWTAYDGEYTKEVLQGGRYYLTQKKTNYSYRCTSIPVDSNRDYSIETTVTHIDGTDQYPFGMVFASKSNGDHYYFAISGNGSYILGSRSNYNFKSITGWTASDAIKTGNNVANKLRIEKRGSQLSLFINDQRVYQLPMVATLGNDIGFMVEQAQTAVYDYLTVNYLDNGGNNNAGGTAVYQDNFTPGHSGWHEYDGEYSREELKGGKYYLTQKKTSYSYRGISIPVDSNRDYSIETTAMHTAGTDQYPYGIVFASNGVSDHYYFALSGNGSYILGSRSGYTFKTITGWTASDAIKTGNNVANKIRIEKRGRQLSLFINDQRVYQLPMVATLGNEIGFIVEQSQTVAFDYLTVNYLDNPVTVVNNTPINPLITDLVYHTDFHADDQNGWVLSPRDSVTTSISGGVFRISRTAKNWFTGSVSATTTKVDMHRNYLIETEAIHYGGAQNYGYGLDFGTDSKREYHFWIAASGYYYIGYSDDQGFNTIVTFTESDAVLKGDNVKNKLAIKHKDGQLYFYVNDRQVDSHPDIDFTGYEFGVSVAQVQDVGFTSLTFGYLDKPTPINHTDTVSIPKIYITSPEVTRGLKVVQSSNVLHVAGIAKDPSGIFSVVVNDVAAAVDANGNFTADIPMAIGDNPLMVVAMNNNMKKGNYVFHVVRNSVSQTTTTTVNQDASQGKFYALLIGVQDYQDQNIPSLEGPINDAASLSRVLSGTYTFSPENITMLRNPTRSQFFKVLDDISSKLKEDDNLLIFYAGHGLYDETHMQGYWFPADARRNGRDTWISNSDLIDYIKAIKSKHTLLISDACFSGSIFKSRSIDTAPKDIQELYKLPSRKAITSGNMKEVPDKSVFMEYLVKRLTQNTDKFLTSEQLFASFRAAVINNSPNGQVPQFGEIRESGDEGGDFVFIRKN